MMFLCKRSDLGMANKDLHLNQEKKNLDLRLAGLVMNESGDLYTWETDENGVIVNKPLIASIAADWNRKVKGALLDLISDRDALESMDFDSELVHDIISAANSMADNHNWDSRFHVCNPFYSEGKAMHSLLPNRVLTDILQHPEEYVIVCGKTKKCR